MSRDEYEKYLARVYKAADFKKERNFIGLAKSLPAEQMRELLGSTIRGPRPVSISAFTEPTRVAGTRRTTLSEVR
ncbi:ATPase (plasmid) [Mycetohabitans rhizoxinica]|uniref:ATPase n=1 Tax=Mycetohabitans rhizoxinica TaxID=412963 RepID=A0ABZ2PS89_9BURK